MTHLSAAVRMSQSKPMKAKRPWGSSPRAEIALSPIQALSIAAGGPGGGDQQQVYEWYRPPGRMTTAAFPGRM
jgi:hypothetical protein